jgi:hypothetical protein
MKVWRVETITTRVIEVEAETEQAAIELAPHIGPAEEEYTEAAAFLVLEGECSCVPYQLNSPTCALHGTAATKER